MTVINYTPRKIESAKHILQHPYWTDFMILNVKSIRFEEERELFGFTIEILGILNLITTINKFLEDSGIKNTIKTDILLKAIPHVLQEKPFEENDLDEWFVFWREFERISTRMEKLYDFDPHWIVSDVDFILMGISYNEIIKLREEDGCDGFSDQFIDAHYKMRNDEITIKEFLSEAEKIISNQRAILINKK